MSFLDILGFLGALGLFVLALVALHRARRDPVARVFALLAGDLAVWNLATVLYRWTGEPAWHWLDVTFSPWTPQAAPSSRSPK